MVVGRRSRVIRGRPGSRRSWRARAMLDTWKPWKATACVLLLVLATALVTGIVVANWTGGERKTAELAKETPRALRTAAQPPAMTAPARPAVPTQDVVDACNRYASAQVGERDKTTDTVKDAAVGAVVGAAVGAAGGPPRRGRGGGGQGARGGGRGWRAARGRSRPPPRTTRARQQPAPSGR